jgi:hypothetical protein
MGHKTSSFEVEQLNISVETNISLNEIIGLYTRFTLVATEVAVLYLN